MRDTGTFCALPVVENSALKMMSTSSPSTLCTTAGIEEPGRCRKRSDRNKVHAIHADACRPSCQCRKLIKEGNGPALGFGMLRTGSHSSERGEGEDTDDIRGRHQLQSS